MGMVILGHAGWGTPSRYAFVSECSLTYAGAVTTDPTTRRERARPLAPEERREAIMVATRPLLLAHGHATTTRLVAEAAGIAEGTVFRVFASKDELFDAVLQREMDPTPFLARLEAIDLDLPLRARLLEATTLMQRRFVDMFSMLTALGMAKPPESLRPRERREVGNRALTRLVAPDAGQFRVPTEEVVRLLRLLTFAGSHPHIASDHQLTPDEVVDVVLHGTLAAPGTTPRASTGGDS